jgi:hypothetical protein
MKYTPHVPFEKIADLVEGRLVSEERTQALSHVADCSDCSLVRTRLERCVELIADDRSESAPEFAVSRAVALLRTRKSETPARIRRWLANLSFDSFSMAPAYGLRAGESAERQLLFTAGENQIQLQVSQSGEDWVVVGQVLGPCAGGEIEIQGAAGTATAVLDESCEFTLPPLAGGEYALTVRLPDAELEVPGLKLGA